MENKEFAIRVASEQRLLKRSCESLLGLCSGLLADNILSDDEINFLHTWLKDHQSIASTWPGEVVYSRIKDVLSDNVITEDEREHLTQTLNDLIGWRLDDRSPKYDKSTALPLDEIQTVNIPGSLFCFTGQFLYGTRKTCEKAVIQRGGSAKATVLKSIDYLVIGTMASHSWAHTSHGRKIEKAMNYKKSGSPIFIINEEQWIQFL